MGWVQIAMLVVELIKLIAKLFDKDPEVARQYNEEMGEAVKSKDFERLRRLREKIKAS